MIALPRAARALLLLVALAALPACRRSEAEYQRLVSENQHLKREIERLMHRDTDEKAGVKSGEPGKEAPDLTLTIVDLWSQRFDDNGFRARQRLANKTIRITGSVQGVAAESFGLAGVSKRFGNVRLGVNLVSGYAVRIRDGIAALDQGTVVTVQGKFIYERMALSDALFVDGTTGQVLYSDDLLSLAAGAPKRASSPSAPPAATSAPASPKQP